MALTERQQQITDLLDQGKTPRQIAKALKITENAVYQHARRIKQANGSASKPRRKATTARKATTRRGTTTARRKPARKPRTRTTTKPVGSAELGTIRPTTPLQAIRARRDEIKQSVKHLADAMQEAERAAKAAAEAHDKALSKHNDELGQLDRAEEALTGKSRAKPRRQSSRKSTRQGTGTVKAPESITPDRESEADLATAQAAAAQANGHTAPAVEENPQAALDAGAEFEDIAQETPQAEPVGVVEEGGFEQQPDDFGDE